MGEVERIIFKRLYVGKTTLLGFYLGILFGVLMAVISFVILYTLSSITMNFGDYNLSLSSYIGGIQMFIICAGFLILFTITGTLVGLFLPIFYNLAEKYGGRLDFDLEQYENPSQPGYSAK